MKLTWIKQMLIAMVGITLMISCEYEFIEVAGPTPPDPNDTTVDTVSYAMKIEPIFSASSCTNCHNAGSPAAGLDLSAGNSYSSLNSNGVVVAGDPEASDIYTYPHPVTGSHNTTYNSVDDANLIYTWIAQGALDN